MTVIRPYAASPEQPVAEIPPAQSDAAAPDQSFDRVQWDESKADDSPASPEGRTVLAAALILLAVAWTAFAA